MIILLQMHNKERSGFLEIVNYDTERLGYFLLTKFTQFESQYIFTMTYASLFICGYVNLK